MASTPGGMVSPSVAAEVDNARVICPSALPPSGHVWKRSGNPQGAIASNELGGDA
jgi:hypothetical protein